ncbi:MAG: A/G-specific adenine glycosylase [Roseburia sp.]|nr:A/G-specific adenine glycosylase [Roseburia sp.]
MDKDGLERIVEPLLDWYRENARALPWRRKSPAEGCQEDSDGERGGCREAVPEEVPYGVWVSEIMLQQTRVETVIPYYERFMRRFPNVEALAAAREDELLKLWEGLGYYSRARNMQRAAQMICREYQGRFPRRYEELLRLPGIGAYTAGAIASIAFEAAEPAVDGNVLRVVTRLLQCGEDIQDVQFRKRITARLRAVYPERERGSFTQSLMELGAVVCVPNGAPKCGECPIREYCGACHSGTQLRYPVKRKKAERKVEEKTVLALRHNGRIALNRRDREGLLSGMWELPNMAGSCDAAAVREWLAARGITAAQISPLSDKKHIFTHVEWRMRCFAVECGSVGKLDECPFTWVTLEALTQEIALPTAFQKVLRQR